jgi:hypothetical protein
MPGYDFVVTIKKVMLPYCEGCNRPRWFVELTIKGDNSIYDRGNYDNYDAALRRKAELYREGTP